MTFWDKQTDLKKDYRATFNTPSGSRVLHDLMKLGFIFGTTAVGNDMRINEGRRALVLHIMQMLEISPEQYRKLYGQSVNEYLETVGVNNG